MSEAVPELAGVLSGAQVLATARSIAGVQRRDGAVPWEHGGRVDAWDHVECLMALDVAGLREPARAGYEWLRREQRPDGSWAARYGPDGSAPDPTGESNHAAYVAVGVLHHWLSGGGDEFLVRMWPVVRRALGFVLGLANPDGTIGWARSPAGVPDPAALLTGCSSLHHALRCGVLLAGRLGRDSVAAEWEVAADRLRSAIAAHCADPASGLFADRGRFSMDWYYPVLGGALRGQQASSRLGTQRELFLVPGSGIRCVADRPWVTGAETCELALAHTVLEDPDPAAELVAAMQHLRHEDGSYWTGLVLTDGVRWPVERSSWTGAAVILAVDALSGEQPRSRIFRPGELEDEIGSQIAS
jgi:hypothetical protein